MTIHEISARRITDSDYEIDVSCSKGTYIRVLCEDIGQSLGCFGTMAALERTSAHGFSISRSVTLEQLEKLDMTGREAQLIPVTEIFSGLPKLSLPPFFARLARSGCEIYLHKIGVRDLSSGDYATLWDNGTTCACRGQSGRILGNGPAIEVIKQLELKAPGVLFSSALLGHARMLCTAFFGCGFAETNRG